MKKGPKPYNAFQRISSVFMILALVWLTISLPIVYQSQQTQSSFQTMSLENTPADNDTSEDNSNPFSNTTEEKNPNSSNSLTEEFLHDQHHCDHFFYIDLQKYMGENVDTYIAYHGELHVPPPDLA